jgi:predicted ATPase
MLLLLDNCDHVVDAVASLAEVVLGGAPGVTILATSRESLRIAGEHEYHLGPLGSPQASSGLTAAEAATFPAVQLFVERASAFVEDFALTDASAPLVGEICRRLDGLPLAIEFAAGRVEVLGVKGLADHLDDSLPLLEAWQRRTATPRHRTMRAVLDWSYGLLSEDEQRFFRALGIFAGGFTVDAAAAVAMDAASTRVDAIDRLADLVAKSLVVADVAGAEPRFRLLDTTRAYALEKLQASGEREPIARRHAEYYQELFARAEAEALARSRREWLADYACEIDNLRSALDWAFSPGVGDVSVGIALTAAALPLWMYLSLIEECRRRVGRALAALAGTDARFEMKLRAALGASLGWIGGDLTETESVWKRTLGLAESLGNVDYQLRALWGLWLVSERENLALAQRFAAVASTPADRLIGNQMIGYSSHFRGNQSNARRNLEQVVANKDVAADRIMRFHLDQQPAGVLARVLWLQGLPEQAMTMAERLVEQAKADDHANSLCYALGIAACPIALWVGNLDLAERHVDLLLRTSNRHALTLWQALGRAHRGVLLIKQRDLEAGLPQLRAAFEELRAVPPGYRFMFIAELAESLAAGQTSGGLATIQEAIDRAERTAEGWIIAELLRVRGELLRLDGAPGTAAAAEACFLQALQLAGTQGALSWELRAATSLARLHGARNRSADAIACLQPVYARFTEGFGTADLIAAKQVLDELRDAGRDP